MNDLTPTRQQVPYSGFSAPTDITVELAKALALVAPVTMTTEQQELWLRAAKDALQDIRADEVAAVSVEVRRTVTRPSQIVPEIARLVAQRRAANASRIWRSAPAVEGPRPKVPVMDRRGQPMTEEDTAELNEILENLGATARYRPDGSKYSVAA